MTVEEAKAAVGGRDDRHRKLRDRDRRRLDRPKCRGIHCNRSSPIGDHHKKGQLQIF